MWKGLQGMGCSKLLAEWGIGHTNFELHRGLFDRGTDTKLWKSSKKVSKNRLARMGTRNTLFLFVYLFVYI